MAEVVVETDGGQVAAEIDGGQAVTAVTTSNSAERLGLGECKAVNAIIEATEVMIDAE